MLIFQESEGITLIDTIKPTLVEDYFWVLDLDQTDFTLAPLNEIEAITGPSVELLIDGFTFVVPASWNVLICDPETSQLDISDVGSVLGKSFHAFVYGFTTPIVELHKIEAVDYVPMHTSFSPSLNKHHMLCHPIDQTRWINLSPADSYNKYFRNTLLSGDLI